MQCRELFQEMAIEIIPPYMIAAKVGPPGSPAPHPRTDPGGEGSWGCFLISLSASGPDRVMGRCSQGHLVSCW